MSVGVMGPTPYPEVNDLLRELLENVQAILGSHLIGMYLDGSLASGDFDPASDIDFVVITDEDISGSLFSTLQAMHERINAMDSPWAIQLEGFYVSQPGVRRLDPAHLHCPNLERGYGERLKMIELDQAWAIHRHILREHGITVIGPSPQTLIDPVSPNELRQAIFLLLHGWAPYMLNHPEEILSHGYQCYIVLSLCRILYTLHMGEVASKSIAARWAQETLDKNWASLIDRAWKGRLAPQEIVPPEDMKETLDFIRFTVKHSQIFEALVDESDLDK